MGRDMAGGKVWTDEEIEYITSNYKAMSYAEMAGALGRSYSSVTLKCSRLNLKKWEWSDKEVQFLKDHYDAWPLSRISKKIGCSIRCVYKKSISLGLGTKPKIFSREKSGPKKAKQSWIPL